MAYLGGIALVLGQLIDYICNWLSAELHGLPISFGWSRNRHVATYSRNRGIANKFSPSIDRTGNRVQADPSWINYAIRPIYTFNMDPSNGRSIWRCYFLLSHPWIIQAAGLQPNRVAQLCWSAYQCRQLQWVRPIGTSILDYATARLC